jgi:N-acyl-D-amino-acid deacylase
MSDFKPVVEMPPRSGRTGRGRGAEGLTSLVLLVVSLRVLCSAFPAGAAEFDVVFRHARLLDGTGTPERTGDLAIKGAKISAVGEFSGKGDREIDATNCVIAPGFIDIHTHAENFGDLPLAENYVRMGVTSIILGNCGTSELALDNMFAAVSNKASVNIATLAGHNSIRLKVMGVNSRRPPTEAELDAMKGILAGAMEQGSVGFSTGLIYEPGKFAAIEELIELAKVAARYNGVYATHLRDEDEGVLNSMQDAFRVGREAKIPVEISHLKVAGNLIYPQSERVALGLDRLRADGLADKIVASLQKARAEGILVTQDHYVYSARTVPLGRLIPGWALEGGRKAYVDRLNDPGLKTKMIAEIKGELERSGKKSFAHVTIVTFRGDRGLNGMEIPEAAMKRKGDSSIENQIEIILDLERRGGALGIIYDLFDEDLKAMTADPFTMFGADTACEDERGIPHPRGCGHNARILQRWVREEKQLSLPEAVRRMTSLPARTFGFANRGELKPGFWADLVCFNPELVRENADFDHPHAKATGFKYVLVNGTAVVENDGHTGAKPGLPIRRGK